jgi:hypothetical protein
VECQAVDRAGYQQRLVEKLLWASIFWMMSSALQHEAVSHLSLEIAS